MAKNLDENIVLIDNADEFSEAKVVQLYIKDKPYLVIGRQSKWHAEIFGIFLKEMNVPFETYTVKERDGVVDYPKQIGDSYKAVGMGHADLDLKLKEIFLRGGSEGYQILIDKEHAGKIDSLSEYKIFLD